MGSARERWRVVAVGSAKPPSSQLFCPACDGPIVSARPPDALNEPATGFDAAPVKNGRETEHVCAGCGKRYLLSERVESTWQRLDADAHVAIPPPKPFSREDD